ncbi:MAG: hypothetical protein LC624_10310 [Halobacteriales archaeon]|nr:hypothetical protein [Halobacteriales archaeon]
MTEEPLKKLEGPITVEQLFTVDGKRLAVHVTFPAVIATEIGMEQLLVAANRCLVSIDSKTHKVEKVRSGGH